MGKTWGALKYYVKEIAVILDGGDLRSYVKKARLEFNPDYIEKIGLAHAEQGEVILRIMYYDCAPYQGTATMPVSGQKKTFQGSDAWLHELARKNLFAVRRGILQFRGFVLTIIPYAATGLLTDADFTPKFEQKGVDMRIGLDMAIISGNRSVDLIALSSNDTDCIPAMKHARRSGIQIALVSVPGYKPAPELLAHCDFHRPIEWPDR